MRFRRKVLLACALATLIVQPMAAQRAAPPAEPEITIVYPQPHPTIRLIVDGIRAGVIRSYPNAQFTERHAQGERDKYNTVILEALRGRPDVLVSIATPMTQIAVQEARGRTPVVFAAVTDPVGAGVAESLDRPVLSTGASDLCPFEPLLRLARQLGPRWRVLGLPYSPSDQPAVYGRRQLLELAPRYGLEVRDRQVGSETELPADIRGLATRSDFIVIGSDNLLLLNPGVVATAAAEERKPAIACDETSVEKGALAGVSVSYREVGERAGELVGQVLGGARAGDLPVAVVRTGSPVLNLAQACALGISIDTLAFPGAKVLGVETSCALGPVGIGRWAALAGLTLALLVFAILVVRRRRLVAPAAAS